jgi:hypothetical protein
MANQPPVIVGGSNDPSNAAAPSGTSAIKKRLLNVENITQAVLWVGVIAVAAAIISSCAMVLDQMHFNNQTYKDQSEKNQVEVDEVNTRIDVLNQQLESLKRQNQAAPQQ